MGLLANEYVVSLENIGGGAAVELFNGELRKVIENIADLNTDPKAKRRIVLEVAIAPTDDRRMGFVSIDCKAKLAPHVGEDATIFFGLVDGRRVAVESNPTQGKLFDKPEGVIVPFENKKGE
jgi:hypothetical protein